MPQNWEININRFDGLVPGFWLNSEPTYGNKEHASNMVNVDLIDPNMMTQGPGLVKLTNGDELGAVTTLIKGMQKISIAGTYICGVGGNKLYQMSATTVDNAGIWPHTIDKGTVTGEDGEDVCYYNSYLFYSYNHSGSAGDIGRYDGATTFDDDYMSTVPTGKTTLVGGVPHQMIVGGDNKMYIANGRYVASYDGTTFVDQVLDLPTEEVVSSIVWEHNRLYIASNRPNVTTDTATSGSIYIWDTTSSSWEYQISVSGKIGALFTKNGIIYLWYRDVSATGGYRLAYIDGNQVKDIYAYTGGLPNYYQITAHKGYLLWMAANKMWVWGAAASDLLVKLFQYTSSTFATAGGVTNAFGTPFIASYAASDYQLDKFSGYTVTASWNSILFDVNSALKTSIIDRIVILTEPLFTGASCAVTLTTNYGVNTITTPTAIAYDSAEPNKTRWVVERNGAPVETFRINLNWAAGSATNPVKIRKILISGSYQTNQ